VGIQEIRLTAIAFGLTAVTLVGFFPTNVAADARPQEVLDLIAAHEELVMKIRPLQDRVLVTAQKKDDQQFKPDGVPVRAKVSTKTDTSDSDGRVPERLRHKDRAASDSDEHGRINVRFAALDENAKAERERVNRPQFGAGLTRGKSEIADARKALAALERELAILKREANTSQRQ